MGREGGRKGEGEEEYIREREEREGRREEKVRREK